jgi:hypothetical protein
MNRLIQFLDPVAYRNLQQQIALNWFSYAFLKSQQPEIIEYLKKVSEPTEQYIPNDFSTVGRKHNILKSFGINLNQQAEINTDHESDHHQKPTCNCQDVCDCNNKPSSIQSKIDEYFKPLSSGEIISEIKNNSTTANPHHFMVAQKEESTNNINNNNDEVGIFGKERDQTTADTSTTSKNFDQLDSVDENISYTDQVLLQSWRELNPTDHVVTLDKPNINENQSPCKCGRSLSLMKKRVQTKTSNNEVKWVRLLKNSKSKESYVPALKKVVIVDKKRL